MVQKPIRLNIGADGTKIEDFLSLDIRPETQPDIVGDIFKVEFDKDSIDEIYCSHFLEHFHYDEVKIILQKFSKWVKVGGILYISVPDFTVLSELLNSGYDEEYIRTMLYGKIDHPFNLHKSGWTKNFLKKILIQYEFSFHETFIPFVKSRDKNGCDASASWFKDDDQMTYSLSINFKFTKEKPD